MPENFTVANIPENISGNFWKMITGYI